MGKNTKKNSPYKPVRNSVVRIRATRTYKTKQHGLMTLVCADTIKAVGGKEVNRFYFWKQGETPKFAIDGSTGLVGLSDDHFKSMDWNSLPDGPIIQPDSPYMWIWIGIAHAPVGDGPKEPIDDLPAPPMPPEEPPLPPIEDDPLPPPAETNPATNDPGDTGDTGGDGGPFTDEDIEEICLGAGLMAALSFTIV